MGEVLGLGAAAASRWLRTDDAAWDNNRVFSQFVYSTTPGVWGDEVEGPDPAVSLVGVLHQAAHKVLSDDSRVFMPPLTQAAVSIERPQGTIEWHITFHRDHDAQSFLADVAFFAASALPTPSGAGTFAYIQVYLTVLFECSVVRVTDEAAGARGALEVFTAAVRATASCAEDMSEAGSDQNRKVLSRIAKQALSPSEFKRYFGNKAARTVARALRALKIGEAIGYFIDLAAEEWVKSTTWNLSITGHEASLGGWEPTCSSPEGDANRLLRNLVFREPFTDVGNSRVRDRLHTLDNWRISAEQAVEPLKDCGDSHNTYVADVVDDWWTDTEDAASDAIVSSLIRAMVSPDPTGGYTAVAAGGSHSCGLRPDRAVECWGSNNNGQLDAPTGRFSAVAAGSNFSCAISSGGSVECWGSNNNGPLNAPTGQFSAISAGWSHACGLRTDNTIACWGLNSAGQTASHSGTFKTVSANRGHNCGLRTDNTIACWGSTATHTPARCAPTTRSPAGATTPTGRRTRLLAPSRPLLPDTHTVAESAATARSPAGATPASDSPTFPQAASRPSPHTSTPVAGCATTVSSSAGAGVRCAPLTPMTSAGASRS